MVAPESLFLSQKTFQRQQHQFWYTCYLTETGLEYNEIAMGDAEKRDFQFSDNQLCGSKKEVNLKYFFWNQGLNET